jgi:hypothetical protein
LVVERGGESVKYARVEIEIDGVCIINENGIEGLYGKVAHRFPVVEKGRYILSCAITIWEEMGLPTTFREHSFLICVRSQRGASWLIVEVRWRERAHAPILFSRRIVPWLSGENIRRPNRT